MQVSSLSELQAHLNQQRGNIPTQATPTQAGAIADEVCIRRAAIADIPFLARIQYEASLPPLNVCFWEEILAGTSTDALPFIEAMLRAEASNWGNASDFWIVEVQGQPLAAAAGYTPNPEDYCPLRLSHLSAIATDLGWTEAVAEAFRERYIQSWGGDCRPVFLTPLASWVVESVAVLPEARGRGLGKQVVKAVLEAGRVQNHDHASIMVINGNDVARHTYESIGFKPYQTFHAEYFQNHFNLDFPGVTKLGLNLR